MFFAKAPANPVFDPVLVCDPLELRVATLGDHDQWARLREASWDHLTEWEQTWEPRHLSLASFKKRLRAYDRDHRRGGGLYLFAFRREDSALVGAVTLTNIRYGAIRSGLLGYWIGAPFLRLGFGAAAVGAVVGHGVRAIELNRIEAACQPENVASQQLLARCGFLKEGRARDYLHINGSWRDHDIHAITARDLRDADE